MTAIAPEKTSVSLEEYYEFEWNSEIRNEYEDGKIIPMAYTSDNHMEIEKNLLTSLISCLKTKGAGKVFPSSKLISVEDCNQVYYPDLSVFLEPAQHKVVYKGKMKAATNPTVIIEILSGSTERKDKGKKARCYKSLPSLQQYVLISQEEMLVEIFTRQSGENEWLQKEYFKPSDILNIADCKIPLDEIYENVEFEEGEAASD